MNLYLISLKNINVNIELLEPQQTVQIGSYSENTLCFLLNHHLQVGTIASMKIVVDDGNEKFQFDCTGKVHACHSDEGKNRVEIHLRQFDKKSWNKVLGQGKTKQQKADKLFSAIKGYRYE